MFTCAFVNGKGGSGKTTAAFGVAVALARHGKRVAVISADGQNTLLQALSKSGEEHIRPFGEIEDPHILIVDGPPRLDFTERALHRALEQSDALILPCAPSWPDLWTTRDSIEHLRKIYPKKLYRLLINRSDGRTALAKQFRQLVKVEGLDVPILDTTLSDFAGYTNMLQFGWNVLDSEARSQLKSLALELYS